MNFTKHPHAVLDYVVNWPLWLGADTITTSEWIVPAGLTKVTGSKTATAAKKSAPVKKVAVKRAAPKKTAPAPAQAKTEAAAQ